MILASSLGPLSQLYKGPGDEVRVVPLGFVEDTLFEFSCIYSENGQLRSSVYMCYKASDLLDEVKMASLLCYNGLFLL